MIRRIFTFFCLFSAIALASRVDYIECRVLPPFEEDGEYWGPYDYRWAYRVANILHIDTKPFTLKRFLAFEIGDSLDADIISESERRLRETDFIGEAKVEIEERDSGTVAIVTVRDLWTTKLAPSFSYKGKVIEWRVDAEEVNLLGLGARVRAGFDHTENYDSWIFGAGIPRILPGHGSIDFFHSGATDEIGPTMTTVTLHKGRWRDSDDFIYSAGAYWGGGIHQTWRDGNIPDATYRADDNSQYLGGKFLLSPKFGIGAGMRNARFERNLAGEDRSTTMDFTLFAVGASFLQREYFTDIDVDAFGRTEDIPKGFGINLRGGVNSDFAPRFVQANISHAALVGETFYYANTYYRKLEEIESIGASLHFSTKKILSGRFCGRLAYLSVFQGLPENFYRVGGQSVLRSYRANAQVGERTAYGNLEWRFFTSLELFTVRFGGAVFVDAGTAWDARDGALSPKRTLGNVGAELRLGSTSSTTGQITRLGVARTFDGLWEFSLSSGQHFGTYFRLEHDIPLP
ncbi:MAG TPA: hypothetical protein ENN07_05025 [candidate division Zixibacteria bacterium]|nr:hypothetical protein [candidate division Zixibacteria bacterium]